MLRDKADRCVECLRYYYGCYPLTASSRDRALKLIATLRNLQVRGTGYGVRGTG